MKIDNDVINGIPLVDAWHNHWLWLFSLYMMRGLPYVVLFMTSTIFFSQLGIDNSDIVVANSWLILPFIFRPFLGRFVLSFESKRYWILLCQFVIGSSLIGIAMSIPNPHCYGLSLSFLFVIAVVASFHDIAIERFYKRSANYRRRSAFMGVRTIAYLSSIIIAFTLPLVAIGNLEVITRLVRSSWITIFYSLGVFSLLLCLYHYFVMPEAYVKAQLPINIHLTKIWIIDVKNMVRARHDYMHQLLFLLLFLLPEMMFLRIITSFLFDTGSSGGLGFSPQEVAFIQGSLGFVGLTLGAVFGFLKVRKHGVIALKWSMVLALVLPKLCFVYLSFSFNSSMVIVSLCVLLDHLCTGYAIIIYALVLLYLTHGKHPTFTYSVGASFLGLSFLISSFFVGLLIEYFSYRQVFTFIFLMGGISLFCMKILPITEELNSKLKQFTKLRRIEVFNEERIS